MPTRISGRSYEPDRIWSRARALHSVDVSNFGTQASLSAFIEGIFKRDRVLGNLGGEGRAQVVQEAMKSWTAVPVETRLVPLMAMRERGLLSGSEYHELSKQQGLSEGQSEYRYRKWSGTQKAVFDMKFKGMLEYGEYSKLLKAKKLSRGAGYYRYRKYAAQTYGVPFRGWEKRQTKPRNKRRQQP